MSEEQQPQDEGQTYKMVEVQNTICHHDFHEVSHDEHGSIFQCSKCGAGQWIPAKIEADESGL